MNFNLKPLALILLCTYLLVQTACSNSSTADIDKMQWLIGEWESRDDSSMLYESWKKENGFTLYGNAYAIENGDTTFSEYARIIKKGDKIYYSVTVNNETTTDFLLIENDDTLIFENKQHDFPQRIIYTRNTADSLYARTEGMVDGAYMKEEFRYGRK
jgi:hypothetical protein